MAHMQDTSSRDLPGPRLQLALRIHADWLTRGGSGRFWSLIEPGGGLLNWDGKPGRLGSLRVLGDSGDRAILRVKRQKLRIAKGNISALFETGTFPEMKGA